MEKKIDLTDMSTFRLLTTFPSFSFLFYFFLTFGIGIPGPASPRRTGDGLKCLGNLHSRVYPKMFF